MKILVIGGAGYVGSHALRELIAQGHEAVVLDNMVRGLESNIPEGVKLYRLNCGDYDGVRQVLRDESIEVVMHFAAYAYIGESMEYPLMYYQNNVCEVVNLLKAMKDEGVKRLIFSSSCAVYGIPKDLPITEESECSPINVYGKTKLDVENMLKYMSTLEDFSCVVFRYFNAAGASDWGGDMHERYKRLIPAVFDVVHGRSSVFEICGVHYSTKDGTCERDFLHVQDIARAHVLGLNQVLESTGRYQVYNLGTGKPYSVREILTGVETLVGREIKVKEVARRVGDPGSLYADPRKAMEALNWKPQCSDIESILGSYWRWSQASDRISNKASAIKE